VNKKTITISTILSLLIVIGTYFQVWQYAKPEIIKTYIESFGVWAPIIYSIIYFIAVFIPYAGTAMTIIGGVLFDPLFGTILVITISSIGSIAPFLIAKKIGREKIKNKIEKTKYKKYLEKTDKNSFMFILYMRLTPIIPYELQNYIAGLIDISILKYFIATFVGLLPGTFMLIYLGNTLTDIQPYKLIILGIISLFAIVLPLTLNKFTKPKEIKELKQPQKTKRKQHSNRNKSPHRKEYK